MMTSWLHSGRGDDALLYRFRVQWLLRLSVLVRVLTAFATASLNPLLAAMAEMAGATMRTLIAGNWKMHGLRAQLGEIETMAHSMREQTGKVDVLVCVPATLTAGAVASARGLIQIGGEDCSAEEAGPFTGDIDAEMVRDAGATSVILGHSERRQGHHEIDAIVAAKAGGVAAWLRHYHLHRRDQRAA
jgi:hypothetical protein